MPIIMPITIPLEFPKPAIIQRASQEEISRFRDPKGRFDASLLPMIPPTGDPPAATVTYIGRVAGTTFTASQSLANVNIGTAATDRYVFICGIWYHNSGTQRDLLNLTIGGVATAIHKQQWCQYIYGGPAYSGGSYIASALVPAGSTATFAVNYTAGDATYASYYAVYSVTGVLNNTPYAIYNHFDSGAPSLPISGSLAVPKKGFALWSSFTYGNNGNYTVTPFTIDYGTSGNVGQYTTQLAGHQSNFPAATTQTVTVSKSGGLGTRHTWQAISFR